jgi:hypothetical protein
MERIFAHSISGIDPIEAHSATTEARLAAASRMGAILCIIMMASTSTYGRVFSLRSENT